MWAQSGKPVVAIVPELDDYLRPDEAALRFARVPQAEMIGVAGARHLWVGEASVRRVLDEIVGHVLPGHGPKTTIGAERDWMLELLADPEDVRL